MAISSTQSYVEYTGDSSTTSFTIPFYFLLNSDISVMVADADGNVTELTNSTDFTVTGQGVSSGGACVLNTAYSNSYSIFIYREPPETQETKYYENGKFPAKSHESALDKLTMLIQRFGWMWDSLALKRPNYFADYYDANGHRIADLQDPKKAQDASTKNYVDTQVSAEAAARAKAIADEAAARALADSYLKQRDDQQQVQIDQNSNSYKALIALIGQILAGEYTLLGDYSEGPYTFTAYNQIISKDGYFYALKSSVSIPYTTTGNTATTWETDKDNFVAVGDAALRQELATKTGALLVGGLSFITPEMFGAIADGVTDDRIAIQSAIDSANANYLAGSGPVNILCGNKYLISLNPASTLIAGEVSAGRGCLDIKSGVTIFGGGTLLLDPTITGTTSGAMITNWSGSVSDVTIKDITLNGNYGTISGSGICATNIVDSTRLLISNVKALNHSGGGIYVRRSGTTSNTYGSSEAKVINNYVYNVKVIGIQSERPDGIQIHGNTIDTSGDNSIDCEGNDSGSTGQGVGRQISIKGNTVRGGKNGIFVESLGDVQVNNNTVSTTGIGIVFNRINTGALECTCQNNKIEGTATTPVNAAIRLINQVGLILISGNKVKNFLYGIQFSDRIDRMKISGNTYETITSCIYQIDQVSSGISLQRSKISDSFYIGAQSSGIPYPMSPRNCPSNYPGRVTSTVVYEDVIFSDLGTSGEVNFVRKTATLTTNTSWAAYAKYGAVTSGYTSLNGNFGVAGEYLEINGLYYKIYSVETSTTEIMKWDATSSSYISGDCTADFTSALTVKTHRAEWGTL